MSVWRSQTSTPAASREPARLGRRREGTAALSLWRLALAAGLGLTPFRRSRLAGFGSGSLSCFQIRDPCIQRFHLLSKRLILPLDGRTLLIAFLDGGQQFRLPLIAGCVVVSVLEK
jgi:hypothetical protein